MESQSEGGQKKEMTRMEESIIEWSKNRRKASNSTDWKRSRSFGLGEASDKPSINYYFLIVVNDFFFVVKQEPKMEGGGK